MKDPGLPPKKPHNMLYEPNKKDSWIDQETKIQSLEEQLERERMRLAACGVAVLQNTEKSKADRIGKDNNYWSAAYGDVCSVADREIELRRENEELSNIARKNKVECVASCGVIAELKERIRLESLKNCMSINADRNMDKERTEKAEGFLACPRDTNETNRKLREKAEAEVVRLKAVVKAFEESRGLTPYVTELAELRSEVETLKEDQQKCLTGYETLDVRFAEAKAENERLRERIEFDVDRIEAER